MTLLFTGSPSARVLVHQGREGEFSLVDALLDPLNRLHVVLETAVNLDKVVEYLGVVVVRYDNVGLKLVSVGVSARVLDSKTM